MDSSSSVNSVWFTQKGVLGGGLVLGGAGVVGAGVVGAGVLGTGAAPAQAQRCQEGGAAVGARRSMHALRPHMLQAQDLLCRVPAHAEQAR